MERTANNTSTNSKGHPLMNNSPDTDTFDTETNEHKCMYCLFFEASMVVTGYGWCDLIASDSACDACCDKFRHFEDNGK